MMVQHTYTNVNSRTNMIPPEKIVQSRSWCLGNSIMTVCSTTDFKQQVIIRRAAGVTVFETLLLNDVGTDTIESRNSNVMSLIKDEGESKPLQQRQRSLSVDIDVKDQPLQRSSTKLFSNEEGFSNDQGSFVPIQEEKITVDPAFLFLQMQPYPIWQENVFTPCPMGTNEVLTRGIAILDRTPSIDIHKIGILYVAPGQKLEKDILGNTFGSSHYERFLCDIGQLFPLNPDLNIYTGGLDTSDQKSKDKISEEKIESVRQDERIKADL